MLQSQMFATFIGCTASHVLIAKLFLWPILKVGGEKCAARQFNTFFMLLPPTSTSAVELFLQSFVLFTESFLCGYFGL